MLDLKKVAQHISPGISLTNEHYFRWRDRDWTTLQSLKTTEPKKRKSVSDAKRLFLSFQGFHLHFKYNGIDRITLIGDFALWHDTLKIYLAGHPRYRDLEYIEDESHAKAIAKCIKSLSKELASEPRVAESIGSLDGMVDSIVLFTGFLDRETARRGSSNFLVPHRGMIGSEQ